MKFPNFPSSIRFGHSQFSNFEIRQTVFCARNSCEQKGWFLANISYFTNLPFPASSGLVRFFSNYKSASVKYTGSHIIFRPVYYSDFENFIFLVLSLSHMKMNKQPLEVCKMGVLENRYSEKLFGRSVVETL